MTYLEAYDAAGDHIAAAIASAWPEITDVKEGRGTEFGEEFAYYEQMSAGIENETPVSDEVTFTFIVLGVWENDRANAMQAGREIFKAGKASAMHLALSTDSDTNNRIYKLQVLSVENSDFVDDAMGERLGVSLMFACSASINRG